MNVAFRVDASLELGTGHLMRCVALAETLRGRGLGIQFICRQQTGSLLSVLHKAAMPVAMLPAVPASQQGSHSWLGVTQTEDAMQTIAALKGAKPDCIVMDHYGLGAEWQRQLRSHSSRLLVIDDLADRAQDCDILLDPNFSLSGKDRYAALLPPGSSLLSGPRYALLRPEYAARRGTARSRAGPVTRVFVFFGGSDSQDMTGLTVEALSRTRLRHLSVEIVVGANYAHRDRLRRLIAQRPGATVHKPLPHLADLMASADVAIGAGGVTTWERMCLGLPALVITIADNQRPASEALAQIGAISLVGDAQSVRADDLESAILDAVAHPERLQQQSSRGAAMVDGWGALRVAECLDPTASEELNLRFASDGDMVLYFDWANDPEVRLHALHPEPISWSVHQEWFRSRVRGSRSHLFVMQARGLPVGQIRFDADEGEMRINYSIDSLFRGRGWARRLVALGMEAIHNTAPTLFRAEVKPANGASLAVFARLGFAERATAPRDGLRVFHFDSALQTLPDGRVGKPLHEN